MNVFDLQAALTLDTSKYDSELASSEGKASSWGSKIAGAGKVAVGAFTAVTGAAAATAGAFVKGTGEVASYGDHIDKMSQKMGLTAESYQEWDQILQHCGSSVDSLKPSMKTLANAAENNSDAFQRLGISQEEVANLSQEDLFEETIKGLMNVTDETERTYLAGKLLGRGATELGPLLNMTSEEFENMKKRTHELGGVMSDEAVKASAAYQDSLQDLQFAISGVKRGFISEMLPSITTVMDGLTEIFAGNSEGGLAMLSQGLDDFVGKIQETVPKIFEVASPILQALMDAIVQNLPQLISVGVEVIVTIATSIINELPNLIVTLIPVFLQAIVQIVAALVQALPEILKSIIEAVKNIMPMLEEIWEGIKTKAVEIWEALKEKVKEKVEALKEAVREKVEKLKESIREKFEAVFAKAREIWESLKQSVAEKVEALKESVREKIEAIRNSIKEKFEAAKQTVIEIWESIKQKIKDKIEAARETVANTVESIKTKISDGFENAKQTVINIFESIKKKIKEKIEGARDIVHKTIEKIKGFFNFKWELPHIKLPHFSVSGSPNPIDWLTQGIPSISVSWYKKAYDAGYMFKNPTIIPAMGLGDGVGSELLIGEAKLHNTIGDVVDSRIGNLAAKMDQILAFIQAYFPEFAERDVVIDGDVLVGRLAGRMDKALGRLKVRKDRG